MPADVQARQPSALALFSDAVARAGERPLLRYFDGALSGHEVDRLSGELAAGLASLGVGRGDRVVLYLQNVPQFVVAQLAVWKLGAIVVPVNPMYRERELGHIVDDAGAEVVVTLDDLLDGPPPGTTARHLVTTSPLDLLGPGDPPPLLAGRGRRRVEGAVDLLELAAAHGGEQPPDPGLARDDVAFLTYTSGTTGPPKGAMNTHGNVAFNVENLRTWLHLDEGDVSLGIAPLFHVTGSIAHVAVSLAVPLPLVLGFRFDAATQLELIQRHRPTFMVGAITAFIALMNEPSFRTRDLTSLTKVYSGGAPIAPSVVEAFERETGAYIHNIYGLTETTSPSHAVPFGARAPVDPSSGALSVGVPMCSTVVRVVDDDGEELAPGEVGELATSGPQVVPGYWQKPEETAVTFPGGELRTGDVGFMDADGWFYVVDRKKDQINAAGFKVWPREVEDVLYEHPAVREAAVVGVPDEYRGETVKAVVSLRPGSDATPDELIAFCKERLAAYKYPRQVELVDELPKTVTGKILRRELRARG